jgi:hypothetical protein
MKTSRGHDTAAVVAIDLATKKSTLLAADPRANAQDALVHPTHSRSTPSPRRSWLNARGGRYEPIGDDFSGSSLQVLTGAEGVPGQPEALAKTNP